jgi:hypothetical protein
MNAVGVRDAPRYVRNDFSADGVLTRASSCVDARLAETM